MKIGTVLYWQVDSPGSAEAPRVYKSRIADMDDSTISVELPEDEPMGLLRPVEVGDRITAYFVTDGSVKNYFESQVLRFAEDVVKLVVLRKPTASSIQRVQRRSFLRVYARLELAVRLGEHVHFLAITEDIGGGGLSFQCEGHIPIKPQDSLACWMLLPNRNGTVDHLTFKAEVVRTKELPETGKQLVMVRFSEISNGEQQKIIRYCFERQLEFRKL